MTLCSRGCGRPATIKGYCRGHYNGRRTKWIRAGAWKPPITAIGVTRRLRALVALGHRQAELCRRCGLSPSTLSHLIRGSVERTSRANFAAVARLYDELSMTPGPSDYHRTYAQSRGWAPPLAWDDEDIDDPAATPDPGERRSVRWDERYLEMRDLGYGDVQISAKLGVGPDSMIRQMIRYGFTPSPELAKASHAKRYRREMAS